MGESNIEGTRIIGFGVMDAPGK